MPLEAGVVLSRGKRRYQSASASRRVKMKLVLLVCLLALGWANADPGCAVSYQAFYIYFLNFAVFFYSGIKTLILIILLQSLHFFIGATEQKHSHFWEIP
jgi:hypothetical protein